MADDVKNHLDILGKLLVKDAEAAGEGPTTMRKSKFASEMERASFITAYGQKAYEELKD